MQSSWVLGYLFSLPDRGSQGMGFCYFFLLYSSKKNALSSWNSYFLLQILHHQVKKMAFFLKLHYWLHGSNYAAKNITTYFCLILCCLSILFLSYRKSKKDRNDLFFESSKYMDERILSLREEEKMDIIQ